jgi:uncharacterized protein (TIGR01777 family)
VEEEPPVILSSPVRFTPWEANHQGQAAMPDHPRKLVIAGGSGFLGRLLVNWFSQVGWKVVVLTRRSGAHAAPGWAVAWDGKTLGPWARALEEADALVNLAGRSVNCRYRARNRRAILSSRLDTTRVLGEAVGQCVQPPNVWLNSSTATIYKHSLDQPMDEQTGEIAPSPEAKDAFSIEVAKAWEQTFDQAVAPRTRKLTLRTAMVLGTTPGTVYRVLRRLVRLGLGGQLAGGRQYVSWIHQTDFCRAVEWLIDRDDFAAPVNLAAPHPLTNDALMRTLRRACGKSVGLPATRWMLEIGAFLLRTETELVIKSRRVVPARMITAGFEFRYPRFAAAVEDLEKRLATARAVSRRVPPPAEPARLP